MIARSRRVIVIGIALAVLVTGLAWWGYSVRQKREFDRAALALVAATAPRLRDALAIETGPPTADRARSVKRLDEHAAAAAQNAAALEKLERRANLPLADAVDDYLVTAREILKKQAERRRQRLELEDAGQALRRHMTHDNRTGAWVKQAVEAKERANRHFRAHQLAAGALDELLRGLPASQQRIAPYVEAKLLIPEAEIENARQRTRQDARLAERQFGQLDRLRAER